jgi:hypothetical protein
MGFLEKIQAHKGGLIRLKGDLYWYSSGWDDAPDRICLVLDGAGRPPRGRCSAEQRGITGDNAFAALLLLDGSPHWVWISEDETEIL